MVESRPTLSFRERFLLLLNNTAVLMSTISLLSTSVSGDQANLVLNGNFETQLFQFRLYPQKDVIHDGTMNLIPAWQVRHGGVQVLNSESEYLPDPAYGGGMLIHLNYVYGPGVIISDPIAMPRKGALYNLSFDMADNPDGGPIYKSFRVRILVNSEVADPFIAPYNVSAPESQRNSISWVRVGTTFVGTGETTQIQFESLTPGAFGALIDNVNVTLINLLDNGSFEDTRSTMVATEDSWYNVLTSPSDIISSWTVASGAIKRAGGQRWQLASDNSAYCVELNANGEAGSIVSDPFATVPGAQYVVLYDMSASPESMPPLDGDVFSCVKSSADGALLTYANVLVSADGCTQDNIGWQTYAMSFQAVGASAVVEFVSRIQASSNGPILDNVLAYQVYPTAKYKSVPLTYSFAATPRRPSIWLGAVLAGLTSFCTWTSILCTLRDYLFLHKGGIQGAISVEPLI